MRTQVALSIVDFVVKRFIPGFRTFKCNWVNLKFKCGHLDDVANCSPVMC